MFSGLNIIRVNEIRVCTVGTLDQRVLFHHVQAVPAHVGYFKLL